MLNIDRHNESLGHQKGVSKSDTPSQKGEHMNELRKFTSNEFGTLRVVDIDGEPWFVGKDITDKLEYQNGSRDIARHVDEEDTTLYTIFDGTQNRKVILINESGLYSLILGSTLPSAKRFRKWVTSEVLPSIRKHGMYAIDDLVNNPDLAIKALTALKEEREKNAKLAAVNEEMKPKAIFADAVMASETSILVGEMAKLLRQNGIDIGQNRLFKWLREKGYLMRNSNMPTQRAMDLGLFEVIERTINRPDGSSLITRTSKVTGKGQVYFVNKFLKEVS